MSGKKKLIWTAISIAIAALTIYAVSSMNKNFTFAALWKEILNCNKGWLLLAVASTIGFIWFEGVSLIGISKKLGYRKTLKQGTIYSAADVYFSAITPSASGGQPVTAWFMMKDGIPVAVATAVLLINLVGYTVVLLVIGLVVLVIGFPIFVQFSFLAKVLIILGALIMLGLAIVTILLLAKPNIVAAGGNKILKLLVKIRIVKDENGKREWLLGIMEQYQSCAHLFISKPSILICSIFWNALQRLSQMMVSFFVFLAAGHAVKSAGHAILVQSFATLGSNSIPIPGAMGVADYLLIDGLKILVGDKKAVPLEMMCRGISFYVNVAVSLVITLVGFYMIRKKAKAAAAAGAAEQTQTSAEAEKTKDTSASAETENTEKTEETEETVGPEDTEETADAAEVGNTAESGNTAVPGNTAEVGNTAESRNTSEPGNTAESGKTEQKTTAGSSDIL